MVLMRYGYSAEETIAHLREKRSTLVLCNKDYEKWLLEKDKEKKEKEKEVEN
jgi:hypothetical protein